MRKDKELAIKLRRQNKSYNEINKILGVPKGTLAGWFKNDQASQKTKTLLNSRAIKLAVERIKKLNEANSLKWKRWRREARERAIKEFPQLAKNHLFIAGLMLYWAEGDSKLKNPFRFTNTDPRMIALYTKFITDVLGVPKEKLRAAIILYPDLSEEKCMRFWSKTTNLPRTQFWKTQFIKGRHPTARLSNGICMVSCGNRQLKEKVTVWIDLLSQKL